MAPGPIPACVRDPARGPRHVSTDLVEPTQPFDAGLAKAAAQAEERRALCRMMEREVKEKKARRAQEKKRPEPCGGWHQE